MCWTMKIKQDGTRDETQMVYSRPFPWRIIYICRANVTFGEGVVIQHDHGSFKIMNKSYDAKNES